MTPYVAAEPPAGWIDAAIGTPKIAESAGAELTAFQARQSGDGPATLVRGRAAGPIPGWVEDMRPAIEARTVALAGAVAEKATGVPMDARVAGERFELRPASDLGGPPIGTARTFIGFDAQR